MPSFLHTLSEFGTMVTALLIVLDPLGVMPIVIGLYSSYGARQARKVVYRVAGGATILLVFFTVTGTWVLKLFGVTLSDMRIGGGLMLLIIALRLVVEGRLSLPCENGDHRAAVAPLISPLIIGPGAITAAVVLAAIHGVWLTALAALVSMLISTAVLLSARFVHRLIGDAAADLISRVMGVFIATIAVSYIRLGVIELIR